MPVLKHAKKKLRQDKKRTLRNKKVRTVFRTLVKKATNNPTVEAVSEAFSQIDKAAKKNLIHKNKAARMKSSLAKMIGAEKKAPVKAKTNTKKKAAVKKSVAKKKK